MKATEHLLDLLQVLGLFRETTPSPLRKIDLLRIVEHMPKLATNTKSIAQLLFENFTRQRN